MVKLIKWGLKIFFKFPEKIRFLFAGGFNTLVGYIIFVVFLFLMKNLFHYQFILLLSYIPTTMVSFLTFKFLVFKTKGKWKKEYLKVVMSSGVVYITNIVCLYLLVELLGESLKTLTSSILNFLSFYSGINIDQLYIMIAQLVSISVMTVVSYLMNKYFSFQVHLKKD